MEETQKSPSCVVLIVEDEPFARIAGADALEDAGFDVIEACDADEALRILSDNPEVSVVFTDIEMPGSLDGLGLARRVHEQWPRKGVVITSGRERVAKEAMAQGDFFMAKPYRPAALVTEIWQSLRRAETNPERD